MTHSTFLNLCSRLCLPGLLLVSLVLRLYRIGEESLWLDEIETVRLVQLPFGEMMNYIVHADSHPPLYSLLLHLWVRIAGTSETAVRFWSAIFGCLSVWATYLTGTVIFNRRTGLIAGLLLAIAPFHVYYSQEARMYALLGLFAAGMMLALWQVTFDQRSRWRYLLVVTSVGALFTQNIALFLIVLQNLWYLLTRHCHHMRPRQWLYLQITIVSLAFFWLPGLYLQLHATRNIGFLSWIQSPTLAHVADVLFEFCGAFPIHSESEPSIPYLGAAGILSLGFLVAFLVPFITQIRHSLNSGSSTTSDPDFSATVLDTGTSVMSVPVATRLRCHQILYLGLWFVIPIVSPLLLSYVFTPLFLPRVCIPALFSVFLILAHGIDSISHRSATRTLLTLAVAVSLTNLHLYYALPVKSDWRNASAFLEKHGSPSDLILHYPPYLDRSLRHYLKRSDLALAPFPLDAASSQEFHTRLHTLVGAHRGFWLLSAHWQENPDQVARSLAPWFPRHTRHDFAGIVLYSFQR